MWQSKDKSLWSPPVSQAQEGNLVTSLHAHSLASWHRQLTTPIARTVGLVRASYHCVLRPHSYSIGLHDAALSRDMTWKLLFSTELLFLSLWLQQLKIFKDIFIWWGFFFSLDIGQSHFGVILFVFMLNDGNFHKTPNSSKFFMLTIPKKRTEKSVRSEI